MRALAALALLLAASPAAAEVLHVAQGSAGGDGSAARPFARVAEALARSRPGDRVEIETGLYEEALVLDKPVRLAGTGKVVLAAPPGAAEAVLVRADATLAHLGVQGGRVGVRAEAGALRLEGVALRGQPEAAVACGRDARCTLEGVELQASFASASGVRVQGRAEVAGLTAEGPFKRAVEVDGGALTGRDLTLRGAATGLWGRAATLELRELDVAGARVACVALNAGSARLREAQLTGSPYGLLLGDGARVDLAGVLIAGASYAGIGATGAEVTARDLVVLGPASDAAVSVSGGSLRLEDALLRDPGPMGVHARLAQVTLRRLTALDARIVDGDFGNALYLYDARVDGEDLVAARCAGSSVEALRGQGALRGLIVERGGLAGVAYEYQSRLDLPGLLQTGGQGTGVACVEGGQGRLLAPRLEGLPGGPWLVDCSCRLSVKPAKSGPEACGKGAPSNAVSNPHQQTGRAPGP